MKFKDLVMIITAPVVVFLFHLTFYLKHIYTILPFLDIPMHLFGGGAIAFSFIMLMKSFKITPIKKLDKIISIICFVGMMAIFAEFMEFLLFSPYKLGLISLIPDTLKDLFFGISGGSTLTLLLNRKLKTKGL